MGINEYIKIGKRIRELRQNKGYTQKEMALKCGIAYSTYSNYENNNREPGLAQIEKIAKALEITTDELLSNPKIDKYTINTIDNYNFHIMKLLNDKDELSLKQQLLDENYIPDSEKKRVEYACEAEWIQFFLQRTQEDLNDFKLALIETLEDKKLTLAYEILFLLGKLNPEGEKKILEEIENLLYNPKYKIPLKPDDWDPYDDI